MNRIRVFLIKLLARNERSFQKSLRDQAMLQFVKEVAIEHSKSIVEQIGNLDAETLRLAISCNTKLDEVTKSRLIEMLDTPREYDAYK